MLFAPFRRSQKSMRRAAVWIVLAAPLALSVTGCYQDTHDSYQAVADTNGDLHRPASVEHIPVVADSKPNADSSASASTSGAPTASDFGMPFYPAAKPQTGLDGIPRVTRDADGTLLLVMETDDTPDQVVAFYRHALVKASYREDDSEGQHVQSLSQEQDNISKSVDVSQDNGKTRIVLTRMPLLTASEASRDALPPAPKLKATPTKPGPKSAPTLPPGSLKPTDTLPTPLAPILTPQTSQENGLPTNPTAVPPSGAGVR
jgi:hypothetical protein